MNSIKGDRAVDLVVSLNDLKKLQKNDSLETFELVPFSTAKPLTKYLQKNKKRTFNDLPFYEGLLLIKKSGSILLLFTWTRKLSILLHVRISF
jgi:hypothetical protein